MIVTLAPGALSGVRSNEESSATLFPFQIITAFKNSISGMWILSPPPPPHLYGIGNRTNRVMMAGKSQLGCCKEEDNAVILDTFLL